MVALPALREVLRGRDFRWLFAVRLIGSAADGLLQAALATFVLFSPERQPDAVKVAAAFAILLLPYSLIGPFAGVFLDRWRRRQVLVRANWLKALCTIPVIALVAVGNDGPALGVFVLVVLGIGRFVLAGISASLPHVVSGRDLVTANALTPTAGTIMSVVAALAGIALRSALGGGDTGSMVILALSAVGFVLAGAAALPIGLNTLGPTGERPGESMRDVARGLVAGIGQLRAHPGAGRSVLVVGVHRIGFGVLTVAAILLVRNTFNPQAAADSALTEFALITGAAGAGALIGAVLTPGASRRIGAVRWSVLCLLQAAVFGVSLVIIGSQAPSLAALMAGAVSIGFTGQAVKVCADTLVQRDLPDDYLGRAFALFDMLVNVCLVAGITITAFLAPASGQASALYAGVALLYAFAATWYARRPRLQPTP
jgi:MFS family permease